MRRSTLDRMALVMVSKVLVVEVKQESWLGLEYSIRHLVAPLGPGITLCTKTGPGGWIVWQAACQTVHPSLPSSAMEEQRDWGTVGF